MSEHGLGRRVNHDPRSLRYRLKATRGAASLVSVQHLPGIPTLDQGQVGSCVPNTGTELLATDLFAEVRPSLGTLTEDFAQTLYHDLTVADDYPGTWRPDDTGSDGLTLGKVFVARGYASGYQHIIDMTSFLVTLQTRAIPVGITWKAGCENPASNGLIRWAGSDLGGHELLACGYDADRQWVLLQNHWGVWGVDGRCWISVADLAAALSADGDATVIIPATAPAPVPTPVAVSPEDAAYWRNSQAWLNARHVGGNAAQARLTRAWAASLGLS